MSLQKIYYVSVIVLVLWSKMPAQTFDIEESLARAFSTSDTVSFFIILEGQADLSGWSEDWTKEEKGSYVYRNLADYADSAQSALRNSLEEHNIAYIPYHIFNGIHVRMDSSIIRILQPIENIKELLPNYRIRTSTQEAKTSLRQIDEVPWGLEYIQAPRVWSLGIRGQGVTVGGTDTGFEWEHDALKRSYRGLSGDSIDHAYNWFDAIHEENPLSFNTSNPCGYDILVPCDDNGHGTHTMGTMVGQVDKMTIGVAPEAKWIGTRNMEEGWGAIASYVECLQWFLAPTDLEGTNPRPDLAPDVINNSWSCPAQEGCTPANSHLIETAIQHLKKAGVYVSVAAGNDGSSCGSITDPPSVYDAAFAVGAFDSQGTIARFSSRGTALSSGAQTQVKPDICAPGVGVLSSYLAGGYVSTSGTSMASPHVVGTVALMISANPKLRGRVSDLEDILRNSASPVLDSTCSDSRTHPNPVYGYGRLNAFAAVMNALAFDLSSSHTQIVQESKPTFGIYPNPTDNYIILQHEQSAEVQYSLYDLLGRAQLTLTASPGSNKIDLSRLNKGVYTLRNAVTSESRRIILH